MDMKIRQIVEVSKLPNGKYVLCVISIAPRCMRYYHKQKEPYASFRWMREEEWSAFDSVIESLALEANYGDSIKKSVDLTPLVHLKIQSVTLSMNQLCQIHPDIKDLKVKNIAMAVKCEIEYGEKTASGTELIEVEKNENASLINGEPTTSRSPQQKKKLNKKEHKTLIALKPDDDLDQQIQSFHIGQQELGCLTPMSSSATINTSASNSASKLDELESKPNVQNAKRSSRSPHEESAERVNVSPPARQRRTVSQPKRFHEFVMQPKRQSFSPKTEQSDEESFEEFYSPKRSRKLITDSKTTARKVCQTPAINKMQRETPQSCSRALFQKENKSKIEMLARKEHKKNMQELMEGLSTPSPPKVKFLSLNDMTASQVMSTISVMKPRLDALFRDVNDKGYVCSHNGINHFLVIRLISDKIKSEMMKKLGELYEKDDTPKFASHFINVLLPEWILSLFMKRYKMDRADAIEHLKAQNMQHSQLVD